MSSTRIVYDINFEDYQKEPGINSGLLKVVHQSSLAHAKAIIDGKEKDATDAMEFGKAFHALLLEDKQDFVIHPDVYPSDDTKKPEKDWNWNATYCKEWFEKQTRPVVSHREADDLLAMVQAVKRDKTLLPYFTPAKSEVSVFAEKDGIQLKARVDTIPAAGPIIEWKSTSDAEPRKFCRTAFDKGYFLSAAFYLDMLAKAGDLRRELWIVGIEKKFPYAHSVLKLREEPISFLAMGRQQYRDALFKLVDAINKKDFPAYGSIDAELVASPWMVKELEAAA